MKEFISLKSHDGAPIIVRFSDIVRVTRTVNSEYGEPEIPVLVVGGAAPAKIEIDEDSVGSLLGLLP